MPCYLLGDGEDASPPPDAREPFAVGSKAMYRGEPVTVTAVHTDDTAGPYYTIALRGGGVRDVDELEEASSGSGSGGDAAAGGSGSGGDAAGGGGGSGGGGGEGDATAAGGEGDERG